MHWIQVDGFSRGAWLLWNEENIKVELLNVHKSYIHVAVISTGNRRWLFTAIYASLKAHIRKFLRPRLDELQIGDPWMIMGDFKLRFLGRRRGVLGPESLRASLIGCCNVDSLIWVSRDRGLLGTMGEVCVQDVRPILIRA